MIKRWLVLMQLGGIYENILKHGRIPCVSVGKERLEQIYYNILCNAQIKDHSCFPDLTFSEDHHFIYELARDDIVVDVSTYRPDIKSYISAYENALSSFSKSFWKNYKDEEIDQTVFRILSGSFEVLNEQYKQQVDQYYKRIFSHIPYKRFIGKAEQISKQYRQIAMYARVVEDSANKLATCAERKAHVCEALIKAHEFNKRLDRSLCIFISCSVYSMVLLGSRSGIIISAVAIFMIINLVFVYCFMYRLKQSIVSECKE